MKTINYLFGNGSKLHWMKNLYLRLKYGAGCCDVYSLDYYLARKIIKPLKVFRKNNVYSYPRNLSSLEEWLSIVDEMIWAFEYFLKREEYGIYLDSKQTMTNYKREQKGFELFGKYFTNLWE